MPEPTPEVQSAGSYAGVAPIAVASTGECNTSRKVTLIQHSPLFANIPPVDCREIVSQAGESKFSCRDTIFLEGDPVRHVVQLTSGCVKVMKLSQNGTEVILRLIGPGEVVEVTGLAPQGLHSSMAQAIIDSTGLIWEATAFKALAERFPALCRNILNILAQRLQELEDRYREISTEKVATRLGHELLRLFNQLGRRVNGNDTRRIKLSREELAQLTGTTLFTVSRLLSEWKERGLLTAGREYVSVCNIQAFREFAENLADSGGHLDMIPAPNAPVVPSKD